MTSAELCTIAQEKIKINIAIINNGFLGMVRQWQEFFYDRNYEATPAAQPGFRQAGLGAWHRGPCSSHPRRSGIAIEQARSASGAFLLNFDGRQEDSVYPMIPVGNALHEMIRRPAGARWCNRRTTSRSEIRGQQIGEDQFTGAERISMAHSFRDLLVWQRAMQLTVAIYRLTEGFRARNSTG